MNRPPHTAAPPTADPAFMQAAALHQAGRLAYAEQVLRLIVARDPRHAAALNLLGVIGLQTDRPEMASQMIARAVAVTGGVPHFHNNLGSALRAQDRAAEAIASYRRAVALKPDYARALVNLGRMLMDDGQLIEATERLRQAAALAPGDLEACWSLAAVLQKQEALDEAGPWYDRALQIAPDSVEILDNLARLRFGQSRLDDSIALTRRILELKPDSAHHWCYLAGLHGYAPDFAASNQAYRRAIQCGTGLARAYGGLANNLADLGQIEEALQAYRQAVALDPDDLETRSNFMMSLHSLPGVSAAQILQEAKAYAAHIPPRPTPRLANTPDPERRIRVGYVSPDFREHPVGFFLERVLPAHDPLQVEVILYSDTLFPDDLTGRLRAAAAQWRPIAGKKAPAVAAMIQADGVDILVDLAGHTGSNRLALFGGRSAPVQASWLGYFGTTGLSTIDYVIADAVVLPVGEEALFTERPVRLPRPYLCWSPPSVAVAIGPAPAVQNGAVTFGSFNNPRKINAEVKAAWARILLRTPGSRLLLKYWSLGDADCRASFVKAFAEHGVGEDRLIFEGLSPRLEALEAYNRIDIALDPFPFGGCTTTADTLWMGVPVVCQAGDRWSGRMSQTILSTLGLDDWVAADVDAYVETAVCMAGDQPALAALRRDLRGRLESSAFCDGPAFTRNLEAAYREMWRSWCAAQSSAPT